MTIIESQSDILDVMYVPNFLDKSTSMDLLKTIVDFNFKEQNKELISKNKMPRLIKWFGDFTYSYSHITHRPKPIPDYLFKPLYAINTFLNERKFKSQMNSVLINYYRNGKDTIGWHSDDLTQIGIDPVISSLSLGETRTFKFKHKISNEIISYQINSGDLLIMFGSCQELWQHSVPAESNKLERINLTFRNTTK